MLDIRVNERDKSLNEVYKIGVELFNILILDKDTMISKLIVEYRYLSGNTNELICY